MKFHKPGPLILLLGFMLLYSCDCVYDYHFVVENKTDTTIYIYCKGGYYDSFINRTDSVLKDTMGYVLNIERYFAEGGCPGPAYEDGYGFIDSIYIYKNDSTHTILNYKDYKKWEFARTKYDGYFKITLQDKDFVTTTKQ